MYNILHVLPCRPKCMSFTMEEVNLDLSGSYPTAYNKKPKKCINIHSEVYGHKLNNLRASGLINVWPYVSFWIQSKFLHLKPGIL